MRRSGVPSWIALLGSDECTNWWRWKNDVSPPEAVGDRIATDCNIMRVSFVRDIHYSDLDIYLEHLGPKMTNTFLDLFEGKEAIKFWVSTPTAQKISATMTPSSSTAAIGA